MILGPIYGGFKALEKASHFVLESRVSTEFLRPKAMAQIVFKIAVNHCYASYVSERLEFLVM